MQDCSERLCHEKCPHLVFRGQIGASCTKDVHGLEVSFVGGPPRGSATILHTYRQAGEKT